MIKVRMCAGSGDDQAVELQIGTKVSTSGFVLTVLIGERLPTALSVVLAKNGKAYDATITWSEPDTAVKGTAYVVRRTVAESGWGVADTEVSVTAVSGGPTTLVVPGITEGAPLRVKVRMDFTSTANYDASEIPTDWTLVVVAQAAEPPSTPVIDSMLFVDMSPGETAFADLLIRFHGGSGIALAYNGGTPTDGVVDYSPPPYSAATSAGGAAFRIDGSPVQLGVISRVPIDTLFDVALQLQSSRLKGLEGGVELMKSEASATVSVRIEKPPAVDMSPLKVTVEFDAVAPGGDKYSATLSWAPVTINPGNALITSYTVSVRTPPIGEVACSIAANGAPWASASATSSTLCTQAAPPGAAYTTAQDSAGTGTSFTVTKLDVGLAACFTVSANNRVGRGASFISFVCSYSFAHNSFVCSLFLFALRRAEREGDLHRRRELPSLLVRRRIVVGELSLVHLVRGRQL